MIQAFYVMDSLRSELCLYRDAMGRDAKGLGLRLLLSVKSKLECMMSCPLGLSVDVDVFA